MNNSKTNAPLSSEDRNRVRRMLMENVPKAEIARRAGICRNSVLKIAREESRQGLQRAQGSSQNSPNHAIHAAKRRLRNRER